MDATGLVDRAMITSGAGVVAETASATVVQTVATVEVSPSEGAIMLDIGTGQPSGILRDLQADAVALAPQANVDSLEPPFSRGIPDAAAWGR